jgi:hypothetical protein
MSLTKGVMHGFEKAARCQLGCQPTGVHTVTRQPLSKGVGTLAPQVVGTGWHAVGTPVGTVTAPPCDPPDLMKKAPLLLVGFCPLKPPISRAFLATSRLRRHVRGRDMPLHTDKMHRSIW